MAKICIVLATYNGEKYLQVMLNSLACQTRPADKIIVVDDGSTDSTTEILKKNLHNLPLQLILCKKNRGHLAAFSRGLEEALKETNENDFIALADQDDVWHSDKLETLEYHIQSSSLVFGDAEIIDKNGNFTKPSWRKFAHIDINGTIKHQIAGINNVTGCLSLFRANLLSQILPIPEEVTVHDRWITMIALKNNGVKSIPQVIVQYRIHGNNAVGGAKKNTMSETLDIQKKWIKLILTHKERLQLNNDELAFAQKLLKLTNIRINKNFAFSFLPWIFENRKFLFLKSNFITTIVRIIFSSIGLPFAKKHLRKK